MQYIQVQIMCKAAGADRLHKQQQIQKHVLIADLIDKALSIAGAGYPCDCFPFVSSCVPELVSYCLNCVVMDSLSCKPTLSNKEKRLYWGKGEVQDISNMCVVAAVVQVLSLHFSYTCLNRGGSKNRVSREAC